jgi:hypothetical protein
MGCEGAIGKRWKIMGEKDGTGRGRKGVKGLKFILRLNVFHITFRVIGEIAGYFLAFFPPVLFHRPKRHGVQTSRASLHEGPRARKPRGFSNHILPIVRPNPRKGQSCMKIPDLCYSIISYALISVKV